MKVFKLYKKAINLKENSTEKHRKNYHEARLWAKQIVAEAKKAERERFCKKLEKEYRNGTIFRVANQWNK